MTFTSYAQNFEDVMLWRALKHVDKGFYIDVGANDPTIDSVTLSFYERGWRGINIEPMQQYYQQLVEERPGDINLQLAVSDSDGELVFFDVPDTGLSTMDAAIARSHVQAGRKVVEQPVRVTTLATICAEHVKGQIHFLKIDVEGLEGAVVRGMNLKKWRPWVLVIEATRPQSQVTSHMEWESQVLDAGYGFAYSDGLNHYYVAEEQSALMAAFKLPPNVFDEFVLRYGHSYSYPLEELLERVGHAETRAHQAEVACAKASEEAAQANALKEQVQAHNRQLATQLEEMYASSSWKITRPLRALKRIMLKAAK